jgi:hypothetical protein
VGRTREEVSSGLSNCLYLSSLATHILFNEHKMIRRFFGIGEYRQTLHCRDDISTVVNLFHEKHPALQHCSFPSLSHCTRNSTLHRQFQTAQLASLTIFVFQLPTPSLPHFRTSVKHAVGWQAQCLIHLDRIMLFTHICSFIQSETNDGLESSSYADVDHAYSRPNRF